MKHYETLQETQTQGQPETSEISISENNVEIPIAIVTSNETGGLGMFSAVFAPVALSMFSTVLFQRLGFIVGNAGFIYSVLMIVIAYLILLSTVLSLSAISTNGAIKGGGAYYMISRALGPEFGGSLGFLFFIANAISASLYISAFVEGLVEVINKYMNIPVDIGWLYLYSACTLLFGFMICIIGSKLFSKATTLILATVFFCTLSCIFSFFYIFQVDVNLPKISVEFYNDTITSIRYTSFRKKTFNENLYGNFTKDYITGHQMSFFTVFAVLFSSITGIMNGANMSGELKNPSKAIPKGTLCALTYTYVTYIIMIFFISFTCNREILQRSYNFLQDINIFSFFVVIGFSTATLSAALANFIGASRILVAMSEDELFWFFLNFAKKRGKNGNPYAAVVFTYFVIQLFLFIGSVNIIAPIASVCFLLIYAAVNVACLGLHLTSAPNFRPTFKYFNSITCICGLTTALIACFLVDYTYASIVILLCIFIFTILHFRQFDADWGSMTQSLLFHQLRKYLLLLDNRSNHVKYWRPHILHLVSDIRSSFREVAFVNDLKKSGLYMIGNVYLNPLYKRSRGLFSDSDTDFTDTLKENIVKISPIKRTAMLADLWSSVVKSFSIKAFVDIVFENNLENGVRHLMQISGIGAMKPNTVCLSLFKNEQVYSYNDKFDKIKESVFEESVQSVSHQKITQRVKDLLLRIASFYPQSLNSTDQIENSNHSSNLKKMSNLTFLRILSDCLEMNMNICILANFNNFKKPIKRSFGIALHSLRLNTEFINIDVWPIEEYKLYQNYKIHNSTFETYSTPTILTIQMAYVLKMTKYWKKITNLRIFLFKRNDFDVLPVYQKLLESMRIDANVFVIEENIYNVISQEENLDPQKFSSQINNIISHYVDRTRVIFRVLPIEYISNNFYESENNQTGEDMLTYLNQSSLNSIPTVFISGKENVFSPNL